MDFPPTLSEQTKEKSIFLLNKLTSTLIYLSKNIFWWWILDSFRLFVTLKVGQAYTIYLNLVKEVLMPL